MNILFIDLTRLAPRKGGIPRVIHSLRSFLESRGNNTFLMYFDDQGADCPEVQAGAFQFPDRENRTSQINLSYLIDLIKEHDIDYIINNTLPDKDVIELGCRLKECLPHGRLIHLVHSVPDYVLRNARSKIAGFLRSDKKQLKPLLRWMFKDLYLYLLERILMRRLRKAYSSADAVVLLSSSYIDTFQKVARLKTRNKFHTIPNPVDSRFQVPPLPVEQKQKRITYVGRIDKEKGVDRMVFIWNRLVNRLPDWSLFIVGDGPLRQECEELAGRLELERIVFTGFQDSVKYINESAVLCLTSDFEGFGLVLIEAQTLGTIPFSFDSYQAVYDIIEQGKNGVIVPSFDLEQYADALYEVCTDEERRRQMGTEAIKKAASFSLDKIGERWLELFKELDNKHSHNE